MATRQLNLLLQLPRPTQLTKSVEHPNYQLLNQRPVLARVRSIGRSMVPQPQPLGAKVSLRPAVILTLNLFVCFVCFCVLELRACLPPAACVPACLLAFLLVCLLACLLLLLSWFCCLGAQCCLCCLSFAVHCSFQCWLAWMLACLLACLIVKFTCVRCVFLSVGFFVFICVLFLFISVALYFVIYCLVYCVF